MIRLTDIHKSFHRVTVLDGLNLSVVGGEMVGLIGPNGAGKSTALRIATGQLLPDSGSAALGGADLQNAPLEARRQLGYVPQDAGVEPFLTGEEVLHFAAEIRGVKPDPIVGELLERFSLTHARRRLTREYSEGMQRRLAIAAALLGEPPALIMDESFNGLDPRGARLMREVLEARRAAGAAILLTGHFLETIQKICTRVALLHKGRIAIDIGREEMQALEAKGRSLEDVFLEATEDAISAEDI